jgi:signal transduction histidine kinase
MSLALPRWLRHPSPRTQDIAITTLVGLILIGTGIAQAVRDHQPLFVLVGLAGTLPLLWRRRYPLAVLAAVLLAGMGLRDDVLGVAAMVALYTIASLRTSPVIWASVAAILGTGALHQLAWGQKLQPGDVLGLAVVCGIAVAFGLSVATRRAKIAALNERAERLDRERELLAEQAVSDERVRIARELHDVVAHNVSLMVVQAQALGATSSDPPVREMTDGIANLGRETMTEMHRTLKLLRSDQEEERGRSPRPGLASLDRLLEQSRAGGLDVDLSVEGAPRTLSQSLDLSAFRIVQEALTNVRKHAAGASAVVTLGYGRDALDLRVRNAGGGAAARASSNGGHGITGMRERVALFGGTLVAGPADSGGFEVHAVLPYGEESAR